VVAVVCLEAELGSEAARAWLGEHFTQDTMDTELNRSTPYAYLRTADGPAGDAQRIPALEATPAGRRAVLAEDLGTIDPEGLSPAVLARAVWTWIAFRL
jgi:hypothetical protein